MAYYHLNKVIRMTRMAAGLSQEELCDGICSVQTLSRIENGRHSVKRETYRRLMERMGRYGEKSYPKLSVDDLRMLDLQQQTRQELVRRNYDQAQYKLDRLKLHLAEHPLNLQYVQRVETVLAYRMGRIAKEEYLQGLQKAIAITVPDYESLLETEFPFTHEETMALMNLADAWGQNGDLDREVKIIQMLLRSLDTGYVEDDEAINTRLVLFNNLAVAYGENGQHSKAIELAEQGIRISRKYQKVQLLPNYYLQIAWDMAEQIRLGEREETDREQCRRYLRMGHAAAALSDRINMKRSIEDYYRECFGEELFDS